MSLFAGRLPVTAAALAGVALVGCGADDPPPAAAVPATTAPTQVEPAEATSPQRPDSEAPSQTGSSTPASPPPPAESSPAADPYVVPAVLDAAYFERVLAALDTAVATTDELFLTAGDITPEVQAHAAAVYSEAWLENFLETYRDQIATGDPAAAYLDAPGPRVTRVTRVITARPGCVWLEVARDYSQVRRTPPPPRREFVGLEPETPGRDAIELNPTPWMVFTDGFNLDDRSPEDPCAA